MKGVVWSMSEAGGRGPPRRWKLQEPRRERPRRWVSRSRSALCPAPGTLKTLPTGHSSRHLAAEGDLAVRACPGGGPRARWAHTGRGEERRLMGRARALSLPAQLPEHTPQAVGFSHREFSQFWCHRGVAVFSSCPHVVQRGQAGSGPLQWGHRSHHGPPWQPPPHPAASQRLLLLMPLQGSGGERGVRGES